MDNNEISFIVKGQGAKAGVEEIRKIINSEFRYDSPISYQKEASSQGNSKAVDPIALSTLIISIPAAILAVADLAERIKRRKELDRTLDKIEKLVVQKKEISVKIIYPNGEIKEIHSADSVEILDYFHLPR